MKEIKKIFIVGGTGRIGTLIISNILNDYGDNCEIIGIQSRGKKEAPNIIKNKQIQIYNNIDTALANADIIIDASSSECTQNNLQHIIDNSNLIRYRKNKNPLLYFAITPDEFQDKKTSDILEKNKKTLSELKKFIFKRTDKVNTISEFLNNHKKNIDSVLANGGKVILTDIHRTEKESFSQVLLDFLVKNNYMSPEEKDKLTENEYNNRFDKETNTYKPLDSFYELKNNKSLNLYSYRSTQNSDFKETNMVGSTHIVEFFDKNGKELYFNKNGELVNHDKAYIDYFYTDDSIAKTLLTKAFDEYNKLLQSNKKEQYAIGTI